MARQLSGKLKAQAMLIGLMISLGPSLAGCESSEVGTISLDGGEDLDKDKSALIEKAQADRRNPVGVKRPPRSRGRTPADARR
jgi:hypothetical protein